MDEFIRGCMEDCEDCPDRAMIGDDNNIGYECEAIGFCQMESDWYDSFDEDRDDRDYAYDLWVDRQVERSLLNGE